MAAVRTGLGLQLMLLRERLGGWGSRLRAFLATTYCQALRRILLLLLLLLPLLHSSTTNMLCNMLTCCCRV